MNNEIISFDVLIEIPKGSRNKYEFDKEKGCMRLDRVLHSSMYYPSEYGYIPETLAEDKDPLDVLVFTTSPTVPGCLIEVKAIGILFMSDDKGKDEKIICVPTADPNYNIYNDLKDLPLHKLKEIEHFFKVYKDLEDKKVNIEKWGDKRDACRVYKECLERYKK